MGRTVKSLRDGVVIWSSVEDKDTLDDDCVGILVYETFHQSFFEYNKTGLYDMGTAHVEDEVHWKVPGELI